MKRMTKTSSHPNRKGLSRFTREFQNKTIWYFNYYSVEKPGTRQSAVLKRPFKCDKCEHIFKSDAYLKHHLRRVCEKEPSFLCKMCGSHFKRRCHLKRHLVGIHKVDHSQLSKFGAGTTIAYWPIIYLILLKICLLLLFQQPRTSGLLCHSSVTSANAPTSQRRLSKVTWFRCAERFVRSPALYALIEQWQNVISVCISATLTTSIRPSFFLMEPVMMSCLNHIHFATWKSVIYRTTLLLLLRKEKKES